MCRVYTFVESINKQIIKKIRETVDRHIAVKELLGEEHIVPVLYYDNNKITCKVYENLKEFKSSFEMRWNIEKPLLTPKINIKLEFNINYKFVDIDLHQKLTIFLEYAILYGNFKADYGAHIEEINISNDNADKEVEKALSKIFKFIEHAIENSFKEALKAKKIVSIVEANLMRKLKKTYEVPINSKNIAISFRRINYYDENEFSANGVMKINITSKIRLVVDFNYTKYSKNYDKLEINQILIEGDDEELNDLIKQFLIYSFVKDAFS